MLSNLICQDNITIIVNNKKPDILKFSFRIIPETDRPSLIYASNVKRAQTLYVWFSCQIGRCTSVHSTCRRQDVGTFLVFSLNVIVKIVRKCV